MATEEYIWKTDQNVATYEVDQRQRSVEPQGFSLGDRHLAGGNNHNFLDGSSHPDMLTQYGSDHGLVSNHDLNQYQLHSSNLKSLPSGHSIYQRGGGAGVPQHRAQQTTQMVEHHGHENMQFQLQPVEHHQHQQHIGMHPVHNSSSPGVHQTYNLQLQPVQHNQRNPQQSTRPRRRRRQRRHRNHGAQQQQQLPFNMSHLANDRGMTNHVGAGRDGPAFVEQRWLNQQDNYAGDKRMGHMHHDSTGVGMSRGAEWSSYRGGGGGGGGGKGVSGTMPANRGGAMTVEELKALTKQRELQRQKGGSQTSMMSPPSHSGGETSLDPLRLLEQQRQQLQLKHQEEQRQLQLQYEQQQHQLKLLQQQYQQQHADSLQNTPLYSGERSSSSWYSDSRSDSYSRDEDFYFEDNIFNQKSLSEPIGTFSSQRRAQSYESFRDSGKGDDEFMAAGTGLARSGRSKSSPTSYEQSQYIPPYQLDPKVLLEFEDPDSCLGQEPDSCPPAARYSMMMVPQNHPGSSSVSAETSFPQAQGYDTTSYKENNVKTHSSPSSSRGSNQHFEFVSGSNGGQSYPSSFDLLYHPNTQNAPSPEPTIGPESSQKSFFEMNQMYDSYLEEEHANKEEHEHGASDLDYSTMSKHSQRDSFHLFSEADGGYQQQDASMIGQGIHGRGENSNCSSFFARKENKMQSAEDDRNSREFDCSGLGSHRDEVWTGQYDNGAILQKRIESSSSTSSQQSSLSNYGHKEGEEGSSNKDDLSVAEKIPTSDDDRVNSLMQMFTIGLPLNLSHSSNECDVTDEPSENDMLSSSRVSSRTISSTSSNFSSRGGRVDSERSSYSMSPQASPGSDKNASSFWSVSASKATSSAAKLSVPAMTHGVSSLSAKGERLLATTIEKTSSSSSSSSDESNSNNVSKN